MRAFVIGITGATGAIYGIRLIEEFVHRDYQVYLTITLAGIEVVEKELGIYLKEDDPNQVKDKLLTYLLSRNKFSKKELADRLHYLPINQIGAVIASGSFLTEGMAIVPCSMSTLAGIAQGRSMNLLERAADVMIKEGRPLLVAPREMPLSSIHLENMLSLSKLGVMVVPPMPGFYHQPQSIDDLIDFVIGKILDRLGISHQLYARWQG